MRLPRQIESFVATIIISLACCRVYKSFIMFNAINFVGKWANRGRSVSRLQRKRIKACPCRVAISLLKPMRAFRCSRNKQIERHIHYLSYNATLLKLIRPVKQFRELFIIFCWRINQNALDNWRALAAMTFPVKFN